MIKRELFTGITAGKVIVYAEDAVTHLKESDFRKAKRARILTHGREAIVLNNMAALMASRPQDIVKLMYGGDIRGILSKWTFFVDRGRAEGSWDCFVDLPCVSCVRGKGGYMGEC